MPNAEADDHRRRSSVGSSVTCRRCSAAASTSTDGAGRPRRPTPLPARARGRPDLPVERGTARKTNIGSTATMRHDEHQRRDEVHHGHAAAPSRRASHSLRSSAAVQPTTSATSDSTTAPLGRGRSGPAPSDQRARPRTSTTLAPTASRRIHARRSGDVPPVARGAVGAVIASSSLVVHRKVARHSTDPTTTQAAEDQRDRQPCLPGAGRLGDRDASGRNTERKPCAIHFSGKSDGDGPAASRAAST